MSYDNMFYNCCSLENVNFNNFITPNILSFKDMFCKCTSLISLNISTLSYNKNTEIDNMFKESKSLMNLVISKNFVITNEMSLKSKDIEIIRV